MSRTAQSITAQEVVDRIRGDKEAYQDAEVLRFLYHNASMSMRQIGDMFDVSGPAIDYWMQEYGIERREMEEGFRIRQVQDMELGEDSTPRLEDLQQFLD
ncbi:hypothetical protein [Haloarcula sp. CGMCC 1.6347]|uniref:hypothetical protein n=1 Tax=Haloarcula sp. CGMCC 1.6347 TaxID=3111455 RepID=UPI00300F5BE9